MGDTVMDETAVRPVPVWSFFRTVGVGVSGCVGVVTVGDTDNDGTFTVSETDGVAASFVAGSAVRDHAWEREGERSKRVAPVRVAVRVLVSRVGNGRLFDRRDRVLASGVRERVSI